MISLSEMTEAAQTLVAAEQATAEAEQALKDAKERERLLREETLPGMMAELGVEKMTLQDGNEITVKQEVYASIPEHRKTEAYKWVEDNGFGGIIKTVVAVPFGRGEMEQAINLLDELATMGITNGTIDRSIHAQTLKAFLKERLAEMQEIAGSEDPEDDRKVVPLELFGARPVMSAKVKQKK